MVDGIPRIYTMPCLQIPGIPPKQFCHDSIGNWVPFVIMRQHNEPRGHAISSHVKKPAKGFVVELGDAVPEVLRLLTPLMRSYETAKKRAEPYTKSVEELAEMRRGHGGSGKESGEREENGVCFGEQSQRREYAADNSSATE